MFFLKKILYYIFPSTAEFCNRSLQTSCITELQVTREQCQSTLHVGMKSIAFAQVERMPEACVNTKRAPATLKLIYDELKASLSLYSELSSSPITGSVFSPRIWSIKLKDHNKYPHWAGIYMRCWLAQQQKRMQYSK